MAFNRTTPIQQRLMRIILGTSGVVLLLTCTAFVTYELLTFRRTSVRELSVLGEIIATNSTAALAFDNQSDATEILAALRAERHIVAACLYDRDGRLFARYPADSPEGPFPPAPLADGYRFAAGRLVGFTPVVQARGSRRLGTLYLQSDLEAMYERLRLYGGIAILVITGSSLVAYTLSRKLQQQISRPILALAETARAVSDRQDYSVRAVKLDEDELGLLTDAFNHMLGQIEEQNLALQLAYDDLRQTQQLIMQQERLRAVGQMASGIAHDINNAISPAALYAESLLEREPDLSPRTRDYLTMIQRSLDDVAQTVSRLREFYRQREPLLALAPVAMNRLVEQAVELTRARWGDLSQQRGVLIEVKRELAPGLPVILGAESEIREALINLIFNAVDALSAGGIITVRTRLVGHHSAAGSTVARPLLCVEVTDSGPGMDEETKRRCLEPFFTTKGERGTGLGLAMVYGMVQRHNARIEIDSLPGRGTTMRLLFTLPDATVELPAEAAAGLRPRSPLRLLVVDDDPALLKSLGQTLAEDGHAIVACGGGQDGIDAFRAAQRAGRPFAAVITDFGMPQVDGAQVAAAVKSASPSTPVFLLTGWGQFFGTEEDLSSRIDRVLNKPPKLRELREALATVPAPAG
jgi:signal transduction histidine kinase/ActR/RegA family two-component response regulator